MKIEHLGGSAEVSSAEQLRSVLALRFGDGVNEYWLAGSGSYPMLSLLVRGQKACMHYFPAQGHPGYLSVGSAPTSSMVVFATNTPFEEIEVPAEAVIPLPLAVEAAEEFMAAGSIPSKVEWSEL